MNRAATSGAASSRRHGATRPTRTTPDLEVGTAAIRVFISHAYEDKRLATAVVHLLLAAVDLPVSAIRFTSADGMRMPGGVRVDERLQREVRDAEVFIGIVSARAVRSSYVLFEMGARWGADKHVLPLLAPGEPISVLPGPMRGLNALRSDRPGQLDQFVTEVGSRLGVAVSIGPKYREQRRRIVSVRPQRKPDMVERLTAKIQALQDENRELLRELSAFQEQSMRLLPTVEALTVTCRFDEAGSGEQVRRWSGIRAPQTIVNCKIPYKFTVSAPSGRAILRDGLVKELRQPKTSELAVRFKRTEQSDDQVVEGEIEIIGRLTANTGFVGFEIRQPFERAFCMTRQELDDAYKNDEWKTEYIGILVQVPTEMLEISVTFPPTFRDLTPKPKPVVFLQSSEQVHEQETERSRSTFSFDGQTAFVRVSKPKQGLQYAIYWTPPDVVVD